AQGRDPLEHEGNVVVHQLEPTRHLGREVPLVILQRDEAISEPGTVPLNVVVANPHRPPRPRAVDRSIGSPPRLPSAPPLPTCERPLRFPPGVRQGRRCNGARGSRLPWGGTLVPPHSRSS